MMGARIRRSVLEQSKRADVGHIGSCLSIADLLAALYGRALDIPDLNDPRRDRFILSKGHAALALYAALHEAGLLSRTRLDTYCGDGTPVAGHPEHALEGVELSTGSLGHGLGVGAGCALGGRLQGATFRTVVLMSDAECNEGSVWEAAMFASQHRLGRLVAIIDANGQQALGKTHDVLDLEPLAERWGAFGWDAHDIDGHDPDQVASLVDAKRDGGERPQVLIARTTFGKGVSFMEDRIDWHYWPMSDEQYDRAVSELDEADGARAAP